MRLVPGFSYNRVKVLTIRVNRTDSETFRFSSFWAIHKSNFIPSRRPRGDISLKNGKRQPASISFSPCAIYHVNSGCWSSPIHRRESDVFPVRRPSRIAFRQLRSLSHCLAARPFKGHCEDVGVPVSAGNKCDSFAIWRPIRM